MTVGDFHVTPAFQRREHHEQIGDAVAFIFVVVARWSSRLGADRLPRLHYQSLRLFIETNQGPLRIVGPLVDFKNVFHRRYEGRVGLGSDHPLLLAMRVEDVFLSVRPIVLSLAFSTMFNSTLFSSRRRRLHLAKPSGGGPHVKAISFASAAPSNIRGRADLGLYLRDRTASRPSSTSSLRVRSTVASPVSKA